MDLQEIAKKVAQGIGISGVFGALKGTPEEMREAAKAEYRTWVKLCHPDLAREEDKKFAELTFKRLRDLYSDVSDRIQSGTYGKPGAEQPGPVLARLSSKAREYSLLQVIATGEVAKIYKAGYTDQDGSLRFAAIKVAIERKDNRLIENEQKILEKLGKLLAPKDQVSLPRLIDTFKVDGKTASVLELIDGYDFESLLEHPLYEQGLKDPYHIGWVMERQLALLGYLHKNLIVHGNIEPRHLMLVPHNHNVVLLDFCFAVDSPKGSDRIRIFTPDFSAPEVQDKAAPHPHMDLYGLGKSMVFLLKGDPGTGRLPSDIPRAYVDFIHRLINPDVERRAYDAWQMAHELVTIREAVSPTQFKPLPI